MKGIKAETGMRAGEVIGLQVTDVDLRRGKGGKGGIAPFGAQTATQRTRTAIHNKIGRFMRCMQWQGNFHLCCC
jgi:integrase